MDGIVILAYGAAVVLDTVLKYAGVLVCKYNQITDRYRHRDR